jgi:hypothetical protein
MPQSVRVHQGALHGGDSNAPAFQTALVGGLAATAAFVMAKLIS